ncbi:MAG TPA: hypothetical protein VIJ40_01070 [Acidimicrobiales bacterium]
MEKATRPNGLMALTLEKSPLGNQSSEVAYWLTVSAAERVAAVEILRQRMIGGGSATRFGL